MVGLWGSVSLCLKVPFQRVGSHCFWMFLVKLFMLERVPLNASFCIFLILFVYCMHFFRVDKRRHQKGSLSKGQEGTRWGLPIYSNIMNINCILQWLWGGLFVGKALSKKSSKIQRLRFRKVGFVYEMSGIAV